MEGVGRRGAPVHRGTWFHLWPSCFAIQLGVQMGPQQMHTALRFVDNGGLAGGAAKLWAAAAAYAARHGLLPTLATVPLLARARSAPAGWDIRGPAHRVWRGEREVRALAAGKDAGSQAAIQSLVYHAHKFDEEYGRKTLSDVTPQ